MKSTISVWPWVTKFCFVKMSPWCDNEINPAGNEIVDNVWKLYCGNHRSSCRLFAVCDANCAIGDRIRVQCPQGWQTHAQKVDNIGFLLQITRSSHFWLLFRRKDNFLVILGTAWTICVSQTRNLTRDATGHEFVLTANFLAQLLKPNHMGSFFGDTASANGVAEESCCRRSCCCHYCCQRLEPPLRT